MTILDTILMNDEGFDLTLPDEKSYSDIGFDDEDLGEEPQGPSDHINDLYAD